MVKQPNPDLRYNHSMKHDDAKHTSTLKLRLQQALQGPLPGVTAQLRMAPVGRSITPEPGVTPRQAAVLIPLILHVDELQVLFTLRSAHLHHHSNEVSFPGGQRESQDASLEQTALREMEEELGVSQSSFEVLGALTPLYVPPSRVLITPYVGWANALPELHPNPQEVAQVFCIPLARLRAADAWTWEMRQSYKVPVHRHDGVVIWGATAMMLGELLALFDQVEEQT